MKLSKLVLSVLSVAFVIGCVKERVYVYETRPTPEPRRTVVVHESAPRKAPASVPQDNPASFEAVTKPGSYSN